MQNVVHTLPPVPFRRSIYNTRNNHRDKIKISLCLKKDSVNGSPYAKAATEVGKSLLHAVCGFSGTYISYFKQKFGVGFSKTCSTGLTLLPLNQWESYYCMQWEHLGHSWETLKIPVGFSKLDFPTDPSIRFRNIQDISPLQLLNTSIFLTVWELNISSPNCSLNQTRRDHFGKIRVLHGCMESRMGRWEILCNNIY